MLKTALVSLCSTRENHEGGECDVMILATVQTYFLLFREGVWCYDPRHITDIYLVVSGGIRRGEYPYCVLV